MDDYTCFRQTTACEARIITPEVQRAQLASKPAGSSTEPNWLPDRLASNQMEVISSCSIPTAFSWLSGVLETQAIAEKKRQTYRTCCSSYGAVSYGEHADLDIMET